MTLEQLGSLGEFVSSIAVVITLVYLALQLRQNTRQLEEQGANIRQTGLGQIFEMHSRHRFFIASDDEAADLVGRGLADYDQLHGVEKRRFDSFMWDVTWAYILIWTRFQDGIVPEELWASARTDYTTQWIGPPGGRRWWETTSVDIPPGFAADINEVLR